VSDSGFTMLQDTTLDIDPAQLLANDIDPDGQGLTFLGFTSGPVTKLDNGLYRVTPAFNTYGPLVLTYAITNDSSVVVETTVTIDVQHVPHPPTTVDDSFAMTEDQPLVLSEAQLLANDYSLDSEAFGITGIVDASGVSAVFDQQTGQITVTPDTHFHGAAYFDYQVTDSAGLSSVGRVNLDVAFVDYPPVIADIPTLSTAEDQTFSITFPAGTVSDVENDPTIVSLQMQGGGALPSWLHFDAPLMTISGTVPTGTFGDFALELRADDGNAMTLKDFTLSVAHVNHAPVIGADSLVTGQIAEQTGVTGAATTDTASGTIAFTDVDATDVHSATIAGVTATGATSGLPDIATILGWLAEGDLTEQAGGAAGSLSWTFSAADAAFDYLGDGEAATLTYAINVTDSAGATTTQNVTITITGTNDAPVVTVPGAQIARTSRATRIAGISIADPDGTTETVTVTTTRGTTAAGAINGATVTGSATTSMQITGTIADINATLATLTYTSATAGGDTISVTANDGITTATQTIAVTTSNTANHVPVIDESTIADGLVSELAGTFQSSTLDSASGTLRFSDADVSDTHKVSVSSVSATGVTWALPSNATLLKYLTQGPVTEPTLAAPGAVAWTFAAPDSTFDYLGAGQSATLSYLLTITDSAGGSVTQTVTITASGTNDTPVIIPQMSTVTGSVTEVSNTTGSSANHTASGTISFADESNNTHVAAIAGVAASGATNGLPPASTMLAWLTQGSLTEGAIPSTPATLDWSFAAPDQAFDYLAAGQTVTLTYTVQITDDLGAVMNQPVTVTVTGSNDLPTATAKSNFTTDNWTALTISGATLLAGCTDPDMSDTLTLASVQGAVGGKVALSGGDAVFTPDGSIGPASFTYTISDGHGGKSTATASLTTTLHEIDGTTNADTLTGGTKQAQIDGFAGDDVITAGPGGDTIIGGAGNDTLTGGPAADTFVYHAGFGMDVIKAFTATGPSHDVLQFDADLFADWAHLLGATKQQGSDLLITLDASDTVLLKNVSLANFTSADARFV